MAPKSLISNLVFSPQSIPSCTQDFSIGSLSWTFPPSLFVSLGFLILVVASLSILCPNEIPWRHAGLFPFLPSPLPISHLTIHSFPLTFVLINIIIFAVTCLNSGFLLWRIHYSGFPQTQGSLWTTCLQMLDF